jgi:hypothetical protein
MRESDEEDDEEPTVDRKMRKIKIHDMEDEKQVKNKREYAKKDEQVL